MAFHQYTHKQSIGRMMHYLYDGYHIMESDVWQFGESKVMYHSELVAHIVPVGVTTLDGAGNTFQGPKDDDDAPMFVFVGRMAHMNQVQAAERQRVRDEEIEQIYQRALCKFEGREETMFLGLDNQITNLDFDKAWNARDKLKDLVEKSSKLTRAFVDAQALVERQFNKLRGK